MIEPLLLALQQSHVYHWTLLYFAAYPVITSIMWLTTALVFRLRWERRADDHAPAPDDTLPFVSVLMPGFNERSVIADSVAATLALDYPAFELIVIDDGSSDGMLDALAPLAADPRLRLVRKQRNEGKAMALNDALPLARGEILLGLDADARPDPMLLRHVVPHFAAARVAAVTGNPRVRNTDTFVARLQAIEFSSIVSLMRRAQRVWGRIVTVSGVCAAYRRSAIVDVGGFSADMATEDIELTWKLQKRFYDVRYEPRAICWMVVPSSWRALARQRLRWARGLMQVLHRHADVLRRWQCRRLWPVYLESALSITWSLCFVFLTTLWLLTAALGLPLLGATPLPSVWGMAIGTICLVQLAGGAWIDRRYDPGIMRMLPYAVWYPLLYWAFNAAMTVASLRWLLHAPPREPVRWNTPRTGAGA